MSSLRPLATITLLAAVGVFLYMKINETEPVMPAGLGEWSADAPQIGIGSELTAAAPSALPPTAITSEAPPFAGPSAPPGTGATTPGGAAPPWSAGLASLGETPKATAPAAATPESSPVARSAEPAVKTPEIPALPGTAIETKPAAAAKEQLTGAPLTPITPITPVSPTDPSDTPAKPTSMFASARVAVQGALDRGELAQALLLLSDWYGDPSLTPAESQEVNALLGQLAGSVIYEGPPAHRLEPPYVVQAGETLQDVAAKYDVPWQLLAKINRVSDPAKLLPGQELKVVRGPFSALVDVSERKMTLMLGRHYAGQFNIELDPASSIEEGAWKVDQKLLTPAGGGIYGQASGATEDRSLLLANPTSANGQAAILRGPGGSDPVSAEPAGRVVRLKAADVNDVYDILSVGSRVTIRR